MTTQTPDQGLWFVTDETLFMTTFVDQLDPDDGYNSLEDALSYATSTDAPTYVWAETNGIRHAIAVAIRGALYFRRDAQPEAVSPSERRKLAAIILAGMLSSESENFNYGTNDTLEAVQKADDLIAASQGANN